MVTIIWGGTFMLSKIALDNMSIYYFLGIRFGIAFLVSWSIFHKKMMKVNRKVIKYGIILGLLMFSLYAFQTAGLSYTTASKTAFISGTNVVIVPVLVALLHKKAPEPKVVMSTIIAFMGVGMLSLNGSIDRVNLGDVLTFISAFAGSLHIIYVGKYTQKVDSVTLAIIQFGVVSLVSFAVSVVFENPVVPTGVVLWLDILFLSVFCTSVAFIIQSVAMKYTSPTHIALLFTCIPVFAGIFGYVFLGEVLSGRAMAGAGLIVLSMLLMELKLPKKQDKEAEPKLSDEDETGKMSV